MDAITSELYGMDQFYPDMSLLPISASSLFVPTDKPNVETLEKLGQYGIVSMGVGNNPSSATPYSGPNVGLRTSDIRDRSEAIMKNRCGVMNPGFYDSETDSLHDDVNVKYMLDTQQMFPSHRTVFAPTMCGHGTYMPNQMNGMIHHNLPPATGKGVPEMNITHRVNKSDGGSVNLLIMLFIIFVIFLAIFCVKSVYDIQQKFMVLLKDMQRS